MEKSTREGKKRRKMYITEEKYRKKSKLKERIKEVRERENKEHRDQIDRTKQGHRTESIGVPVLN